jgi:hypothetical protein
MDFPGQENRRIDNRDDKKKEKRGQATFSGRERTIPGTGPCHRE